MRAARRISSPERMVGRIDGATSARPVGNSTVALRSETPFDDSIAASATFVTVWPGTHAR